MTRRPDCLVTLDAGTGSGRCVVFDLEGRPVAAAQEPFAYRCFADPDLPLVRGFDIDPAEFWATLATCARRALGQLPHGTRVLGVIATSQREGCAFVDAAGEVLYAGPNLDARAAMEGLELQQRVPAARLHAITGHAPPYIFPIARFLWFRKRHDAARIAWLLMLNDWITYLLSGMPGAEPSNASESMLFDVAARAWAEELAEAIDLPRAILPPLRATGTQAGRVTPTAAAATGIPEGTPVFVGGADTESALLGSGLHRAGGVGAVLGTTTPLQLVTDRPVLDPAGNLWTSCHVVPDRWVLESNVGDTGGAYRWLLDLLLGGNDAAAHAAAEAAVRASGLPARPVFAYLGPTVFDLGDLSPFKPAGVVFRFPMMHIDRPSKGEVLHGFLENVAYALRGNWEQIAAVSGTSLGRLAVSGGMTRSAVLVQLVADALGVPVDVAEVSDSAALGSAVLAAVGVGAYASIEEAAAAMTRSYTVEPASARVGALAERYAAWREIYDRILAWSV